METHRTPGIGDNNPPPASITERLRDDYSILAETIEAIARRANEAPRKIETEADLDAVSKLIRDARDLVAKADADRTREKRPYWDAGKEVDAFFKAHIDRLDRIANAFQSVADTYAREQAAAERRRREEEARKLREAEEARRREAEAAKRAATQERKHDEADQLAARAVEHETAAAAPAQDVVEKAITASGVSVGASTEWQVTDFDIAGLDLEPLRYLLKRDAIEAALKLYVRNGGRQLRGAKIEEVVKARIR